MSSDLVFSAAKIVSNRYLLCRLTARTVRCLHFVSANTHDAIVDAFTLVGTPPRNNLKMSTPAADFARPPRRP